MRALAALLPLLLLPLLLLQLLLGGCAAAAASGSAASGSSSGGSPLAAARLSTELASLASEGDALRLWERATASAADAVVEALRQQDSEHSVELKGVDMEELRIWHGQSVSLGLEVDGQRYSFMVQSEPDWQRLASVLGTAEGGLLPREDWESLHRHWLSPVSHGSLLPDFALEGPVDVYLSQPTALQLFLPHASDAGVVQRVLLRQGAAVMVRGARSVSLRRGLDLPAISLSEFAGIVTADASQQQPLGVLHLLAGVQAAAQAHWNASHPDQTLGLVALELDLSPRGAALLAAPTSSSSDGGSGSGSSSGRRLRARRVSNGAIELLPRDGPPPGAAPAAEGAVALPTDAAAAAGGEALNGAWPLTSVHPAQLQSYEKLLRQVITSRLFRTDGGGSRGRGARGGGGGGVPGLQGLRVATDVQLRLVETEAEATMLLQMQLELERRPKQEELGAAAGGGGGGGGRGRGRKRVGAAQQGENEEGGGGAAAAAAADGGGGAASAAAAGSSRAAAYLASLGDPPDALEILANAAGAHLGPHEVWTATVQVRGDAQRGTLQFAPLHLQRVGAASDSLQFGPHALASLLGLGNSTEPGEVLLA